MEDQGRWRWREVEREAAGRWLELETPLKIGKEAPLEVVVGVPLKLAGERERTGLARAGKGVASSGRGRRVNL